MPEPQKIVIICGPTGSGKTAAALEMATQNDIEIISADSRQVFKHLDIGTAKPSENELKRAPHHLIDVIEPGERYTAFRFLTEAEKCIGEIQKGGKKPVIVGGTGLYLRALTDGIVEIDSEDDAIGKRLESDWQELGPDEMHARLTKVDPVEAERVHPNNRARIVRALEIYELTGRPKSEFLKEGVHRKSQYSFEQFCLVPDREWLYGQINERVDRMIASGLLEELQQLCQRGLKEKIRSANVIGYKELLDHIDEHSSLEEAISLIKQNSRRFAKRQLTWFRNQTKCRFFANRDQLCDVLNTY